ncbi:hypothetical protein AB1Y20_007616 [Prymnesium parvum]|uniref:S1 motif domain-containing protein n=1 Tax=Prymnesium parvum TaxID=97485 RepID=A0AB34IWM1_PRYPA
MSLADKPLHLSELTEGTPLPATVVGTHRSKLFVRVPVVRRAARGATAPVDALLKLGRADPLARRAAAGSKLQVFVSQPRVAEGRLVVRARPRRAEPGWQERCALAETAERLEEVERGRRLEGRVLRVSPRGARLDVGVSRKGRRGRRRPVDAWLPEGERVGGELRRGARVEVFVLRALPCAGRLLVTQRDVPAGVLEAEEAARRAARRVWRRRRAAAALRRGEEREGIVRRVEPYGAIVNVGARTSGLVHISELSSGRVADVEAIVRVGDRVLVKVLQVKGTKLSLRLLKVFDEEEPTPQQQALLKNNEYVKPKFGRVEDSLIDASVGKAAPAEAGGSAETLPAEEDPYAWAAASPDEDETEGKARTDASDAPEFDDSYFEDKYDLDYY